MNLVFNEISVSQSAVDQHTVNVALDTFMSVYVELQRQSSNISRSVIVPFDINFLQIAPNYTVAQWRNSRIDKDVKMCFLGFCEHMHIEKPSVEDFLCYTSREDQGEGVQLAIEINAPLLSFSFQDYWRSPQISCQICESLSGNITSEKLLNFSTNDNLAENGEWIKSQSKKVLQEIRTSEQLLSRLSEVYPSLEFIENALKQITHDLKPRMIPNVTQKLSELEAYFFNWDGGEFRMDAFPKRTISPESNQTLERFKDEHSFLYNGRKTLVSLHMRYTNETGIPGRIYFYPDHDTKKCAIFSLITKLPTVNDPKFKGC